MRFFSLLGQIVSILNRDRLEIIKLQPPYVPRFPDPLLPLHFPVLEFPVFFGFCSAVRSLHDRYALLVLVEGPLLLAFVQLKPISEGGDGLKVLHGLHVA